MLMDTAVYHIAFSCRPRVLSSDMLICAEKVNIFQQQSKKGDMYA